jgi:hypothetical protein
MSIIQGVGSGEVSTGLYPFPIGQSLRFNDDDNTYLERTMVTPTDNLKFTIAFWVKRANLGTDQYIISADDGANAARIQFEDDDTLRIKAAHTSSGTPVLNYVTTRVFKDIGSWYHIVFAYDSANSTDTSRARLYVNGTEITDFSTYTKANLNDSILLNSANDHHIGNYALNQNNDLDGYLAQFYLVDGEALTPSTFGETKNDIWVAKNATTAITALSNGFGNNGFYLTFADSSDIGADSSGQDHDFTNNNLTASDVVNDSPTKNHATLGAQRILTHTLSDGNLKSTNSSGTHGGTTATFNYPTSGKWYHEVTILAETDDKGQGVGIGNQIDRDVTDWGNYLNLIAYLSDGTKLVDTGYASYGTAHAVGNIIGVAYNADDQELQFYLATSAGQTASSQGTIDTSEMDGQVDFNNLCPLVFGRQVTQTFNFGQSAFNGTDGSGTLPTGFAALNTANLADPSIDPNDDETPDQYFDTKVYTPNNGTLSVTGLEFQPDWVWIKVRNTDLAHAWFDSVRGTSTAGSSNTAIGSNRSDREGNGNGVLSSFDSGGFTVAGGSSGSNPRSLVNKGTTANEYVAWTWKAGGAPTADNSAGVGATPTAGSVKIDGANLGSALAGTVAATRLSANTESGFSIVTFEAPSVGSKTVAHGLSSPPEMLIFKSRSNNTGWIIQHVGIADADPFTDFISFTTGAASDNATVSDDTAPTSSVFTIGSGFTSGNYGTNQVAYCFHSVDGFSKFAHYIGNGQSNGTFVFTGFRPAMVIIKSTSSGERWNIFDNKRDPDNIVTQILFPSESVVESTSSNGPDFFANGFKVRGNVGNWNHDGERYIYMAIADQPFKYSNAR